jgi:phenylalanyl-tRNA synthetase beta chain
MKLTLNWLNDYVSVDGISPDQLGEHLTMLGLEVDAIQELHADLDAILTARILNVRPHPNADKLVLCDVDTGSSTIQVVCGAPNAKAGLMTAIALPGVTIPGGMKIKKAKVRGEQSSGMLCSAKELGIREDHSGIMELDVSLQPGMKIVECLGLKDTLIEIDLTPNRPDCASVIGIAREVAGFTRAAFITPVSEPTDFKNKPVDFSVTIEDEKLCPRYAARKLTNVTIKPSPWWLQRRLLSVGMRPINNVVDVTNLVMLEYGQPLHAFDCNKLRGGQIIVRRPHENEKNFSTLDGTERILNADMLMICDSEGPVAVAGIMGGLNSEVSDDTTVVLLESACFNPVSIRKTARILNLPSEASYRFERGVDPNGVDIALERAVQLICELSGAEADAGGVDQYPGKKKLIHLNLRVQRVCSLLGINITTHEIIEYLTGIGFVVKKTEEETVLEVIVPSFRVDIEREIDLVEEIARLVGYNDIPNSLPRVGMDSPPIDTLRELRKKVADILTSMGISEAINYSFVSKKHVDQCNLASDDTRRSQVTLLNPLSEDQAVMRSMLLPGLLENIKHNINYQQPDIRLFETGKTFIQSETDKQPLEHYWLCVVQSGSRFPGSKSFYFSGLQTDFFDIKGVAEYLLQALKVQGKNGQLEFIFQEGANQTYSNTHTCLSIIDGQDEIGRLGLVNKDTTAAFSIKKDVYFFELDLVAVCNLSKIKTNFNPLPRFPSVKRDIALLVHENVPSGELVQAIYRQKATLIEHAELFDVYRGEPIEKGMKSVALSVTDRSSDTTLNDETVDSCHEKIVSSLMSEFGGRYREGQK